ncbi:MAG: hypothetical protein JRI68_24855 [Deltaproteobacteria bacterium]|nr:hypothetical protein [Deltaproteobacteria bacterium]
MGGTLFRLLVPVAVAAASSLSWGLPSAWAQGDTKAEGGKDDKGDKDEDWTELQVEEDDPETEAAPPPPPPPPPGGGGSQYRNEPTAPPPDPVAKPTSPRPDDEDGGASRTFMRYWEPQFAWRSIAAEFDVWSTEDFNCFTWDIVARLGVEDFPAYFDIDIPWTYLSVDGGDDDMDQLQFGNPTFGGHGGGKVGGVVGIWGGATVSIPTTFVDENDDDGQGDEFTALALASRARALVDAHRFFALYVPLRFMVGVEVQIHPYVYARAEFAPAFYIPTGDAQDLADALHYDAFFSVMDQIYEVEALSPIGLGGGVRFQLWWDMNENMSDLAYGGDRAQTALEPYITYSPPFRGPYEVPVFARVGLLFALDDPVGFGFDDRGRGDHWKVATLRTQVGARY